MSSLRAITNGDVVIIINHDQVSQLQVTSSTCSFARDTLHRTAISEERKGMIADKVEARLVKLGSCVRLCNCETNSICESLTKGASGDFDTRCILTLWVSRSDAVDSLL